MRKADRERRRGAKIPPEFIENFSEDRPMHRRLRTSLLNHYLLMALMFLFQIAFILSLLYLVGIYFSFLYTVFTVLSVVVALHLLDQDSIVPAYRTMWLCIVILLPPAGLLFYLFWGQRSLRSQRAREYRSSWLRRAAAQPSGSCAERELQSVLPQWQRTSEYLTRTAAAPLFGGTCATYYPFGEDVFTQYLADLEKAEKFIFIEYFIIDSGVFWNSTLDVLERKAAQGVDVRVIYDAVGCLLTLPLHYYRHLRQKGIQCYQFAPVHISTHLSDYTMMNHRDHRKITVIDGNVGFTGGINFADEYINLRRRFGIWKDTAVRLEGSAVYGLTSCFLENWDYLARTKSLYDHFRPSVSCPANCLVQPYGESPLLQSNVALGVYLNLIQKSRRSLYIVTPYLVIDSEIVNSLIRAAQSGVDVRIILPGIPDKKMIYAVTRSFCPLLLAGGVRIFQYTPGFTHAKMFLADNEVAVIGTVNMDYRSLFLHFENCCAFYGGSIVEDVARDFARTLAQCRELTLHEENSRGLIVHALQRAARIFAPLI